MEVVDGGDAAEVEQVLAGSAVAGAAALPVADMVRIGGDQVSNSTAPARERS